MIEAEPQVAAVPAQPRHKSGSTISSVVQWLLSVVVIAAFVMTYIVQAFMIPSDSMENTLQVGDYVLVNKIAYAHGGMWTPLLPYHKVKRGDIVVFRYPVHPAQHFVKRVIGLPGDRVHLVNKRVYVNGQPLEEPYTIYKSKRPDIFRDNFPNFQYLSTNVEPNWWVQMRKLTEDGNLIVPEGYYFVLGDNRDDSLDSRYWGFVPQENIVGRPLIIYWSVGGNYDEEDTLDDGSVTESRSAKVTRFAYGISRLFHDMRWDRTMKVVR